MNAKPLQIVRLTADPNSGYASMANGDRIYSRVPTMTAGLPKNASGLALNLPTGPIFLGPGGYLSADETGN